jgi:hypothetical protein
MTLADGVTLLGAGVGMGGLLGSVMGWLGRGIREDRLRESAYVVRNELEAHKQYCERHFEAWEALWVNRNEK